MQITQCNLTIMSNLEMTNITNKEVSQRNEMSFSDCFTAVLRSKPHRVLTDQTRPVQNSQVCIIHV